MSHLLKRDVFIDAFGFERSCHARGSQRNQSELSCRRWAQESQHTAGAQWIDNSIFTRLDRSQSNTKEAAELRGLPTCCLYRKPHSSESSLCIHTDIKLLSNLSAALQIYLWATDTRWMLLLLTWPWCQCSGWWNCSQCHQRIFLSKE